MNKIYLQFMAKTAIKRLIKLIFMDFSGIYLIILDYNPKNAFSAPHLVNTLNSGKQREKKVL